VVDRTPAGPAVPRIDAEPSGASRQMAFGSDLAVGLGRGSLSWQNASPQHPCGAHWRSHDPLPRPSV